MSKISIIDTHCHIYSSELAGELEAIMNRSAEASVSYVMMPNVDGTTIEAMLEVEKNYPNCLAMMGLHPCSVNGEYREALKEVEAWFAKRSFSGVGETGIDLYWDKTWIEEQKISFDYQIGLAKEHQIPVIIHSRDSLDITIAMIRERQDGNLKGIFHCFTGSEDQASEIMDLNFHLGIGGVVTYKNSDLPLVLSKSGLSQVVLETDAPYLPPVPHRGKKNEPAFITHVLDKLSEIFQISREEVGAVTTSNAIKLFGLTPK